MDTRLLFFVVLALLSCSKNPRGVPERNYYFEVKAHQRDNLSDSLTSFLNTTIPLKKYTITYTSGQAWPYYAALELDETIRPDSLMSPHWYLHKMILKKENATLQKDDNLVRIELMPQTDTIPNYRVEIYERDSIGLSLSGTSGIHFVDTVQFSTRKSLFDYYLKSIIRYSFK